MYKKILLVTNGFYPDISPRSFRATELAKEFARQGHDVTVLTHPRTGTEAYCQKNGIVFKDLGSLTWPIPVPKGSGIVLLFWRIITRFSALLFEYPFIQLVPLLKKALKGVEGYDALISVAVPYPIHWGVALVHTKKNPIAKVWIADCGDPYMGQENDTFKPPFYFGWVEKWFCRKADFITIPIEGAKNAYYKEFHNKIKIIPQGFSFPKLATKINKNKKITFAYAGNIGSYQHYALPFFSYLNSIQKDFLFIVYTREKHIYLNNINKNILEKCLFYDYKDRDLLIADLNEVDFLLHFPYKIEIQKSLKLVDYFYLSKPILSFVADEQSYNALDEFLDYNFSKQLDKCNVDDYHIENVAKQFLALLDL